MTALSAAALALDAVDGHVARRTDTVTGFGARFDMEVDAFLIAVLALYVAPSVGWWVAAIGAMRYAYVAASWAWRWLRRPLPPRFAAKVVAAVQGVVLVVASAGVLPVGWVRGALAVALLLLVHSFGIDVWRQWRLRHDPVAPDTRSPLPVRSAPAASVTVLAVAGLWFALSTPALVDGFAPVDLIRIPIEGLVLVTTALVLPARLGRVVAVGFGLVAATVTLLAAVNAGFRIALDRPFHVLGDWSYLANGVELLQDTIGGTRAVLLVGAAAATAVALIWLLPLAVLRVTRAATGNRRRSARIVLTLAAVWVACAAYGGPAAPLAGAGATALTVDTARQVRLDLEDTDDFEQQIGDDPAAGVPADERLAGLAGKDVLIVWVESYGRVALEGVPISEGIIDVLDDGTDRLAAAGYDMRSAFLTSPTFGAGSWLAHGTLQSGLWVDSEQRYGQLLKSDRLSLTSAFEQAGWRTVFTVPANTRDWPEGAAYYGFDQLNDSRNVGYAGPKFGYASMPDQYTLEHFRRTELAPVDRRPVMAEIDLVSSHHPWSPLPELVNWDEVGDGSVFQGMPERGEAAVNGKEEPATAQRYYGKSIEYTWRTIISFLLTYPDPNRVLLIAGDHQPHAFVSGTDSGRDVPVTVISQDPAVMGRIADWQWQPGLRPGPDASVWPMSAVRDRLFTAFGQHGPR
ncbi:CDP-alcohol phosphatidyltransferase [Nocardioides sp. Root614]|nr:CDP-alcohol phosphatidyltransferase [Nocardioides sp. Root614]KRA88412.1 CDP-alcohol phosphatidyltransferase [Nocardioides sp. Root682]